MPPFEEWAPKALEHHAPKLPEATRAGAAASQVILLRYSFFGGSDVGLCDYVGFFHFGDPQLPESVGIHQGKQKSDFSRVFLPIARNISVGSAGVP